MPSQPGQISSRFLASSLPVRVGNLRGIGHYLWFVDRSAGRSRPHDRGCSPIRDHPTWVSINTVTWRRPRVLASTASPGRPARTSSRSWSTAARRTEPPTSSSRAVLCSSWVPNARSPIACRSRRSCRSCRRAIGPACCQTLSRSVAFQQKSRRNFVVGIVKSIVSAPTKARRPRHSAASPGQLQPNRSAGLDIAASSIARDGEFHRRKLTNVMPTRPSGRTDPADTARHKPPA
jgi:hypothetical protein